MATTYLLAFLQADSPWYTPVLYRMRNHGKKEVGRLLKRRLKGRKKVGCRKSTVKCPEKYRTLLLVRTVPNDRTDFLPIPTVYLLPRGTRAIHEITVAQNGVRPLNPYTLYIGFITLLENLMICRWAEFWPDRRHPRTILPRRIWGIYRPMFAWDLK